LESSSQFEKRKGDHIRIALDSKSQAEGQNGLDQITLIHEALPDLNFKEVDLSTSFFSQKLSSPLFISSMTAGHEKGHEINLALARFSGRRGILMGVGSQRRELSDAEASLEWKKVRAAAPQALLLGNIGLAQLIQTPLTKIQALVDSLQALGLFVHLNPLQECLQPEGTPDFREGLSILRKLTKSLSVPVILKEVGCGFSVETLKRLQDSGVHAVDVSGYGGTHWGRIEGYRSASDEMLYKVAETFSHWGIPTAQCMLNAREARVSYQIWASGGVRNGLEAAKLCALGATQVGLAKPFLEAAVAADADQRLDEKLTQLETEMKIAFFCSGVRGLEDLKTKKIWELNPGLGSAPAPSEV
jgi:isopentenyl-diphosphate delta-isomerase